MATNMDKSLYQAPVGLGSVLPEPDIEIEIEDPESVKMKMGDIEIEIEPKEISDDEFEDNLAEYMDESELSSLANDLLNIVFSN